MTTRARGSETSERERYRRGQQMRVQEENLPRWQMTVAWISLGCAVVAVFGLAPLAGSDLWMHLTLGRWIWAHGWVPSTDPFSYITEGQPFIAHSWLAEVLFYLIERSAGTMGLILLRFGLISLALMAALKTARLLKAPWPAMLLLAPIVLGLLWGRLEFRPQLFTSVLLAVELWLIVSVCTGQRSWQWLWLLPPIYVLWVNTHAGWATGMTMLGAITIALVLMEMRRRWLGAEAPSHLPLWAMALVLVGCLLALFVNPYGARLLYLPAEMEAPWIREMGFEWQAPFARGGWQRVSVGAFVDLRPMFFGYAALLAGVLYSAGRRWRRMDLVPLCLMALWLALSLWHLRAVSDAVLITAPLVAASLPSDWRLRQWHILVGSGLMIALTAMGLWLALSIWNAPREGGFRWSRGEPTCLVTSIERLGLSGRIFTTRPDVLLWRFHPSIRVDFIWDYVAGPERSAERLEAWRGGPNGLHAYFEQHQVDVLALDNSVGNFVPGLMALGWTLVHMDDRYFMMVRDASAKGMPTYRRIKAWENTPVDRANAIRILTEADQALQSCPSEATFAWSYKAKALRSLGRYQEALDAALNIPPEQFVFR
jgi:hypothetical protein